jgi:hypothetical protein
MTPENAGFYHAAYIVVALVYGLYTASLIARRARVRAALRDALASSQADVRGAR